MVIPPAVFLQLESIKNYISNVLFNPEIAIDIVGKILDDMESLEVVPERGFNADDKVGKQISKTHVTYGIVTKDQDYLIFYSIASDSLEVHITNLVPVRSDYAKLFL